MKIKKYIYAPLSVLIVALLLLGLPIIAGNIANEFNLTSIDPDGSFMWISIHHIAQALMFIPLILLLKWLKPHLKFGFSLGDWKKGLHYVLLFTLFFLVYTVISFGITLLTDTFSPYGFPLNARNVFGYLGFQLLLSGPSEEILFRAFGITVLAIFFKQRLFKGKLSVSNLLIATIFGLAHIGIYFSPFHLSYSIMQVMYAFGLGLIYGDCYERTGSVLYPMMIHSISNVIAVGATMLISVIL